LIAAGLALIAVAIVVLLVAAVQSQRHLRSAQRELDRANEQIERSKGATADLEKSVGKLKTELDAVSKARSQLQSHLDEANSDKD